MRPLILLAVGLPTLGMSGCLGNQPTPAYNGAIEGTGVLSGVVTDEEWLPIDGANVTLLQLRTSVTTNGNGQFAFASLPEGALTLRVEAAQHLPKWENITVEAHAETRISIPLETQRSQDPHEKPFDFVGRFSCTTTAGDCYDLLAQLGVYIPGYGPEKHTFTIAVDEGLSSVSLHLEWTPQSALVDRLLVEGYAGAFLGRTGDPLFQVEGPSPLDASVDASRIQETHLVEKEKISLYVALSDGPSDGVAAAAEQDFTVSGTLGYWGG